MADDPESSDGPTSPLPYQQLPTSDGDTETSSSSSSEMGSGFDSMFGDSGSSSSGSGGSSSSSWSSISSGSGGGSSSSWDFSSSGDGEGSSSSWSSSSSYVACFVLGALVETPDGPQLIQTLTVGDMVMTRDHGAQPIRWIGRRSVIGKDRLAPVRISAGFLGATKTHYLSQQHRVHLSGPQARHMFGEAEVLVPAKALVGHDMAAIVPCDEVTYFHLLMDRHEILTVDGVQSESFYPGDFGLSTMSQATLDELLTLFPELNARDEAPSWPFARPVKSTREGQELVQLL